VMSKAEVKRSIALQALTRAQGHVRNAITLAKKMRDQGRK